MKATLYTASQPARELTSHEISRLQLLMQGTNVIADYAAIANILGAQADLLSFDGTRAVWGMSNAADYDCAPNPEATAYALLGDEELVGPILIVWAEQRPKETAQQSATQLANGAQQRAGHATLEGRTGCYTVEVFGCTHPRFESHAYPKLADARAKFAQLAAIN